MSEAGRDTAWRWLVALAGQLAGWVVLAILAGLAFASLPACAGIVAGALLVLPFSNPSTQGDRHATT